MRRDPANLPTMQDLWKVLRYEPSTGLLYWRARTPDMFKAQSERLRAAHCVNWNAMFAERPALNSPSGNGYSSGALFCISLSAHVVCWAMVHGRWPDGEIDHQNGNGRDNRPRNLRNVTHAENVKNAKLPRHNRSGVIGVSWDRGRGVWQAGIQHRGKKIALGRFPSFDAACAARRDAERRYGFHPNHGRVACAS